MKKVILSALVYIMAISASAQQFVDLGLPSGTLWKSTNETGGYVTHLVAMAKYKDNMPTSEQWSELVGMCEWQWTGKGAKVIGLNGNSIFLPAAGFNKNGSINEVGEKGYYWMSDKYDRTGCGLHISFYLDEGEVKWSWNFIWNGYTDSNRDELNEKLCLNKMSVRLVSR